MRLRSAGLPLFFILGLLAAHLVDEIVPPVPARLRAEQAPEAHRLLEGRASQGKLALVHPN